MRVWELAVLWGYPDSRSLRRHLASVGIKTRSAVSKVEEPIMLEVFYDLHVYQGGTY